MYVVLWMLVLGEGFLIIGLIRSVYELRRTRSTSMVQEKRAPVFEAVDQFGQPITSAALAGRPYGLLFVTPSCLKCWEAVSNIEAIRRRAGDEVIIVCQGSRHECLGLIDSLASGLTTVIDEEGEILRGFGITSVPTAVIVDSDGVIESIGQIFHGKEIEEFIGE
ncbi:MAG: hypothetical protein KatS3mg059_0894 [Thermomicrobiales bacterium]|nr:MAG: hypothetical protein KatS3mg059_0894 [Thermomicrobiales bacterium]